MKGYLQIEPDVKLYYESHGRGPAIICTPGWAYSSDVFERNIADLAKYYRVICYDPRSHGRSSVTAQGNSYQQQGRDLNALLKTLELDKFILLGWSLGIYTVYNYLKDYGLDGLLAVIAVDESPKIIKQQPEDWGEGEAHEITELINLVDSPAYLGFFRNYLVEGFETPPDEALVDRFTNYAGVLSSSMAAELLLDSTRYNFEGFVHRISQQVPLLNVIRSSWAKQALPWIEKNQPRADTKVLGEHLMLYEYAEEFNKTVIEFLQKSL